MLLRKPREEERKTSLIGVEELDEALGGGIQEGYIITLSGPTGSGKTIFASQFLYHGAKSEGEVGLYITMEDDQKRFLKSLSSLKWSIKPLLMSKSIIILDYPPTEIEQLISPSNPIVELVSEFNVKRVVLDSILPLGISTSSMEERERLFLRFIDNVRKWETTTILVSEDTKDIPFNRLPVTSFGMEKHTDGWIHLYYFWDEAKGERSRALEILKMRGISHPTKPIPFSITDFGIEISWRNEKAKRIRKKSH